MIFNGDLIVKLGSDEAQPLIYFLDLDLITKWVIITSLNPELKLTMYT